MVTRDFHRRLIISSSLLTLFALATVSSIHSAETMSTVTITVFTEDSSYHLRQPMIIFGNLTSNGSPVDTALVALQIEDSRGNPFYFRTIPIGNPSEEWSADITGVWLTDLNGSSLAESTPNSNAKAHMAVKNNLMNQIDVVTTVTVCDENLIPFYCAWAASTLSALESTTSSWEFYIPEWVKPGKAVVFMNLYNQLPENQGTPYTREETAYFHIMRNPESEPSYSPAQATFNSSLGRYEVYLKAPPDRYTRPGAYTVHVNGRISPAVSPYSSVTFTMTDYPCPPQAAFTYSPLLIYQNMTVTFDASSSSAEGYNDTIVSYEWTINDPYDPQYIMTTIPETEHIFEFPGIFIVELNVTDNEGLWSTTSKPIVVQPEFDPTANFTWLPSTPIISETITFDASSSELGWSAARQEFSPIVSYIWVFGDGGVNTSSNPTMTHEYTDPGNYSVTLTVVDEAVRSDEITKIVEVLNITVKTYDVTNDGFIDIKDLLAAALAYGSQPGDPDWNPRADVNLDGFVDIKDILAIALHYGEDP